ncbi:hypothetical protein QR680_016678 [Steinernema hermaphroditum]|uniref:Uncharacterized protein n=1 Tax=Steinernema hermaphroditum TaxID=289476 RepID=A0AA39HBY3_9BILA|nr:hypothetical protein QR680_016678 [Steinernema hermaphroditum]
MSPIRFRLLGRLLETKAPKKEEAYPDIITIEDEEEGSLARIEPTEDLKRELEEKEERIRTLEAENRDLQEQLRLSAERVEEMEQEPSVLQHIIIKKERLDEDDIQKLKELEEKANTYRRRAWKHEHFSNYRS